MPSGHTDFSIFVPMQIEALYQNFLSSTGVTTDTRNIAEGNMFFALKGDNFNANTFVAEAFAKGAKYVVADELLDPTWKEKFGDKLWITDNALKTLQALAGHHRNQLKCPVVAITGSNGKTTTKELLAAVLSKKYKTYATKGNLNNHIGIPLTLLSIKNDVEMAVVEMGANHQGEIASYCEYVRPGYGLITNVGMAHTEGFGGFEGVVKGKTELYRYIGEHSGKIFVSADNDLLLSKVPDPDNCITYGKATTAYCHGQPVNDAGILSLVIDAGGQQLKIQTRLVGEYNFENAMSAICIGKYFKVDSQQIKEALECYTPGNNRSQKITLGSNTIILDAYNANPSSMTEALKNFAKISAVSKVVILGEMMELGDYAKTEHEKIAALVKDMPLTKRIFVGSGFHFLEHEPGITYFSKTDDLKAWFKSQQFENTSILIKGSRKNELEKILKD
jgi:UDP-N-acetylmuramoyl-tripeptide--D-alanyl-D-alanine ligase